MWRYFDAAAVLSELGSIAEVSPDDSHNEKYSLSEVIGRVTASKGEEEDSVAIKHGYMASFVLTCLPCYPKDAKFGPGSLQCCFWPCSCFSSSAMVRKEKRDLSKGGANQSFLQTGELACELCKAWTPWALPVCPRQPTNIVMLTSNCACSTFRSFYYKPQESTLAYPTCQLTKGFDLPIDVGSDLADYIFMSALAYESFETTTHLLEKWFGGPGVVVDEDEFVREYRRDSLTASSPAFWKLFSVPSVPGFAVMSIRGR